MAVLSQGDEANRPLRVERRPASREMEIHDYLRLIRRRWWIVILVPAVAAGIVLWVHSNDPVRYSAKATVTARSLIGHVRSPYVGTNSTAQFAADFEATAFQQPILEAVSVGTQVSPDRIKDGLSVTPVSTAAGMSALIDVQYVTTERDRAGPVAKEVAMETLRALFEPALPDTVTKDPIGTGTAGSLDELLLQPQTLTLYPTVKTSGTQSVLREIQIAVGAGLFLAIFMVIIADVLSSRSRETKDSQVSDDETSAQETSRTAPRAPASGAR
jgi:capsular polysaccharide biosynthesis protein